MSPKATAFRSHTCGELRPEHVGLKVKLSGAVDRAAGDRTYDLRDHHGRTRVVLKPGAGDQALADTSQTKFTDETVLLVEGTVVPRPAADDQEPTGGVLVEADKAEILSSPVKAPLFDFRDKNLPEADRIRHRYLYLRSPEVHANLVFRSKVVASVHRHLVARKYEEVETPLLAERWDSSKKEAFLAVRDRNRIFALPGARPIHGTLLMAAGFDRVYEVARRFRRLPKYSAMRQPEYTVADATAAYVDEASLHAEVDDLLGRIWADVLGPSVRFQVAAMTSEEAQIRYGSDCPDLRLALQIQELTPLTAKADAQSVRELRFTGGAARGLRLPDANGAVALDDPKVLELAGPGTSVHFLWLATDGTPQDKGSRPLDPGLAAEAARALQLGPSDLGLVVVGASAPSVAFAAGQARLHLGRALKLPERKFALARVTRVPYYRFDAESREVRWLGDPLTAPVEGDLEAQPREMRGQAFLLSLDGVNIGGGAIRNHDPFVQARIFAAAGLPSTEVDARYRPLSRALAHGVPPHGRFALGVDRLVALLRGLPAIHEVIPLPKMPDGTDPLTRSPWPIDQPVVRGMFGL